MIAPLLVELPPSFLEAPGRVDVLWMFGSAKKMALQLPLQPCQLQSLDQFERIIILDDVELGALQVW